MEVWHNILEGIGLSVIILVVVISLLIKRKKEVDNYVKY